MDVCFIMPCYNAAKWIEESLKSLERQTIKDFEVIVIDDGSSDESCEIVEQFALKDKRFRLERLPTNSGGCYQPRKHGILLTDAKWIAPLDADDIVDPDYLSQLLQRATASGADIIYPAMYTFDGITSTPTFAEGDYAIDQVYRGSDIVKDTLEKWKFGAGGGILRREIYLRCFEKYDSTIHYNFADETLTRQLLYEAPKVGFSPTPYYYRVNPDSTSRAINPRIFELLQSQRDVADFIAASYPADSETAIKGERWVFHGYFEGIRKLAEIRRDRLETPKLRKVALENLEKSRRRMRRDILKGKVSPRYMLLSRLSLKACLIILPLIDRLKK